MKLWKTILVASICVASLPLAPAAGAITREPYEGPAVIGYAGTTDCADPVRSQGIVCVALPAAAAILDLRVRDASELPVGGVYFIADATGTTIASGTFCGLRSIPLDEAAATAVIRLEAINGPLACLDEGQTSTGPATQGVIALRLR